MTHVAHVCASCGSLTIFLASEGHHRRCAHCGTIVHASAADAAIAAGRRLRSGARLAAARPRLEDADARTGS
jgi:hypothetical protein